MYNKYDEFEKKIFEEKPYNWKKHFFFQLPEMFGFILKLGLIALVVYAFTYSLTSVLVEKLPEFCKVYSNGLR